MEKKFELNSVEQPIVIDENNIKLRAILGIPANASGLVVFAHGSGSGRLSPRNNYVARVLQKAKIGTLLLDLLSESEERDRNNVFDIDLLADRLLIAKEWLARNSKTRSFRIGYFGASTGAGAALVAAAKQPENVAAVVSRGGRPDLAGQYLEKVEAPTLLIVGGFDDIVIELNQQALAKLQCKKDIKIVPGATHLFEETGTLEEVGKLAQEWFEDAFLIKRKSRSA